MKRKVNINNVAYADSVGYSCIVPKEKGSFCNLECNPKLTVNYSSAFKIAGALIWPMVLLIIAIKIKRSSDPVEKKMKEGKRRKKRLLYLHSKLPSGLVPL